MKKTVPVIWLVVGCIWDIWFIATRGKMVLNSDMASDMILADLLNKEHSFGGLSRNWQYSSGLRYLGIHRLFQIWLCVFPNNWNLARTISMAVALSMFVAAMILVFYLIGRKELGIWAAAFSVFPGGSWYFLETITGGLYLSYIVISLLSFSLILLSVRNGRQIKGIVSFVLLLLISIGAGIDGIFQAIIFYMPLCFAAITVLIIDMRKHCTEIPTISSVAKRKSFIMTVLSFAAAISAFIGYEIGLQIIRRYCYFDRFGEEVMKYQGFLESIKQYIWSYGFALDRVLISLFGVASMCGLIFGIIVICFGISLLLRVKKLSENEQLLILLAVISIVFSGFCFSYMGEEVDIRQFQPLVPMGYILVVMAIGTTDFKLYRTRLIALNLTMILLFIASLGTVCDINNKTENVNILASVVDRLVEQGYVQGVSLYRDANLVTELSNGKIEMWAISNESPDTWDERFQKKDHLIGPPQGRYFYLFDLTKGEEEAFVDLGFSYIGSHSAPTVLKPVYSDDKYVVYGN